MDALRILLCVNIVYFHILHDNIMNFIGDNNIYEVLKDHSKDAQWAVEFFFLISGYFLYCSKKNHQHSILQHIVNRVIRLWPVLMCSILINVVFFHMKPYRAVFDCMFLQNIGLAQEYAGINWYVSVLFWTDIFFYAILQNIDSKKSYLIIAVLVYFAYMACVAEGFGRGNVYGVINLGLMRGIAGVGLGILTAYGMDCLADQRSKKGYFKMQSEMCTGLFWRYLITMIELFCAGYLVKCYLFLNSYSVMLMVLVSEILLIIFLTRGGGTGKAIRSAVNVPDGLLYIFHLCNAASIILCNAKIYMEADLVNQQGRSMHVCICVGNCYDRY